MTRCPQARGRTRTEAGATLVELLVAIALLGLALGTVAMLATAVLAGFEADPAAADQHQRARGGIAALVDDVQRAGSGFVQSSDLAPGTALPALVPDIVAPGAWAVRGVPRTLTTLAGRRGAAHATLRAPAAAGDIWLRLERPGFCAPVTITCGFAAGDDVLLFDEHGRVAFVAVSQVVPPLDLELAQPLGEAWRIGASVSAVVAHAYALRPDPATGLAQLVRRLGAGPANPVVDFVTRFDVEWHGAGGTPFVRVAPDGTLEDATAGPRPPPSGTIADPQWPAGENCAYARDGAGAPVWRGSAAPVALASLGDGPWCPSAAAPSRWDVDLAQVARVRVTFAVAVASARLRPPASVLLGDRRSGARLVPDLTVVMDLVPGRRNGGQ